MFESANLKELESLTMGLLTPQVVHEGQMWNLDDPTRRKIRHAMFGSRGPNRGRTVLEQRELLNQFTKMIVEPIMDSFPPAAAPTAVLILYQEFVDAVFIQPIWEGDVGGAG